MEHKSNAAIGNAIIANDTIVRDISLPKKTKKRGVMHVIRAAMYMLRSKSAKSRTTNVEVVSTWKTFVGSMRPFHVQSNQSHPRPIEVAVAEIAPAGTIIEVEHFEAFTPPLSPAPSSVASSSGLSSQYASVTNLQDLDPCKESDEEEYEEDEDKYFDDKCADEMIDEKAEVFIAKFYESMRIQRESYANIRRNQTTKETQ